MVLLLVRRGCCVVVRSPTESVVLGFVIYTTTIQSAVFVLQYFVLRKNRKAKKTTAFRTQEQQE